MISAFKAGMLDPRETCFSTTHAEQNNHQSLVPLFHHGPSSAHSPSGAFAVWWTGSASDHTGYSIAIQGPHTARPPPSHPRTPALQPLKRLHRSFLRPLHRIHNQRRRLAYGTFCLRLQLSLVGPYLPRGQDPPSTAENHALFQMGCCTPYSRNERVP